MKKIFIIISSFSIIVLLSGCATWEAVKSDSSKGWKTTKKVSKDAYNETKDAITK